MDAPERPVQLWRLRKEMRKRVVRSFSRISRCKDIDTRDSHACFETNSTDERIGGSKKEEADNCQQNVKQKKIAPVLSSKLSRSVTGIGDHATPNESSQREQDCIQQMIYQRPKVFQKSNITEERSAKGIGNYTARDGRNTAAKKSMLGSLNAQKQRNKRRGALQRTIQMFPIPLQPTNRKM